MIVLPARPRVTDLARRAFLDYVEREVDPDFRLATAKRARRARQARERPFHGARPQVHPSSRQAEELAT